ncbi:hypothetical protein [Nostoc sp.]
MTYRLQIPCKIALSCRTFPYFLDLHSPLPNPDNLSAIASHPNFKPLVRKNQRTNQHRRSQLLWLN